MTDAVNHPRHYNSLGAKCLGCGRGIECIDIVEHMSFCDGNAIKYLWRAGQKGSRLEDLKKARFYIERAIALEEKKEAEADPEARNNYVFDRGS